jgi:hypothetical protein
VFLSGGSMRSLTVLAMFKREYACSLDSVFKKHTTEEAMLSAA